MFVNLLAYAFSGSNPLLPISLIESRLGQRTKHGKQELFWGSCAKVKNTLGSERRPAAADWPPDSTTPW
jgi:hypothetical protein